MKIVHIDTNKIKSKNQPPTLAEILRRKWEERDRKKAKKKYEAPQGINLLENSKGARKERLDNGAVSFKVGDVVQLRSGGPKMTIKNQVNSIDWHVEWFSGNQLNTGTFNSNSLVPVDCFKDGIQNTDCQ
jgi:uncharacterized protein YodC (DUF2158 family)